MSGISIMHYHENNRFPRKTIHKTKVPTRIVIFAWTISLGKILSVDCLTKGHIVVIDVYYKDKH